MKTDTEVKMNLKIRLMLVIVSDNLSCFTLNQFSIFHSKVSSSGYILFRVSLHLAVCSKKFLTKFDRHTSD